MESKTIIPGQYLIAFQSNTTADQRIRHMTRLSKLMAGSESIVIAQYEIGDFYGYAATMTSAQVAEQRRHDDVIKYIEADQVVTTMACSQQNNADWGLDRVSQLTTDLDGEYHYDSSAGAGVDAYIIDTGILLTHSDFGGRATWGANYVDTNNVDCNGHGTHVAGTVAGTTWGIAKSANLIAVKVLSCAGSGSWAGVTSGVQFVANQYGTTKRPSVANMSLGGGKTTMVNDAVTAAVKAGVTFVVAAGNENQDACNVSPASTPEAVTVGATTISGVVGAEADTRSYFSNYGTCTTLMAPGELITSAWIGSNTAIRTISGTSMASPHVCGVSAMVLGLNPSMSPTDVKSWLTTQGTKDIVQMVCSNDVCRRTPNVFLHNSCSA